MKLHSSHSQFHNIPISQANPYPELEDSILPRCCGVREGPNEPAERQSMDVRKLFWFPVHTVQNSFYSEVRPVYGHSEIGFLCPLVALA